MGNSMECVEEKMEVCQGVEDGVWRMWGLRMWGWDEMKRRRRVEWARSRGGWTEGRGRGRGREDGRDAAVGWGGDGSWGR